MNFTRKLLLKILLRKNIFIHLLTSLIPTNSWLTSNLPLNSIAWRFNGLKISGYMCKFRKINTILIFSVIFCIFYQFYSFSMAILARFRDLFLPEMLIILWNIKCQYWKCCTILFFHFSLIFNKLFTWISISLTLLVAWLCLSNSFTEN